MTQITNLNKIINNTKILSPPFNSNFTEIKTKYNYHDTDTTGIHGLGTENIGDYNTLNDIVQSLNPKGRVIDVWIPDDLASIVPAPDADVWKLCDGSVVSDVDSVFNGLNIPDLDNKYLIGAGSLDTPGSIATDTINATPVGATDHMVNIEHTHTLDDHTHDGTISHNHRMAHHHSMSGYARIYVNEDFYGGYNNLYINMDLYAGTVTEVCGFQEDAYSLNSGHSGGADDIPSFFGTTLNMSSSGYTSYYTGNDALTIGSVSSSSLSNALNPNQDIQPESLKVKRYIRYK